jgi:putative endonuclease
MLNFRTAIKKLGTTKQKGDKGESFAEAYLLNQGLRTVAKNFRYKTGEIDLIMEDNQHLIFVEVRYRKNIHHGSGSETVDYKKQQKLIKTASYFLQKHGLTESRACRFDVVGISGSLSAQPTVNATNIEWLKNAFTA